MARVRMGMCSNARCNSEYFEVRQVPKFCGLCGSPTVTECPKCKKGLNTFKEQTKFPAYCEGCREQLMKSQ